MIRKLIDKITSHNEDNKIILKNIFGAFTIKGLALIISLFTMPVYIEYFDNQATLGLWFTILSVLSWILNFDLGIGNGLRNYLSRVFFQKNYKEAKKYVSSAYLAVTLLVIIWSVVFIFAFQFIDWNLLFNIENDIVSHDTLYISVSIVFLGIMLQLILKLINSVLYSIQKSAVNNLLSLITSVIGLLCVLIAKSGTNDSNLIMMSIVHICSVILPLLFVSLWIFFGKQKDIKPSFRYFDIKYAKQVLGLGGIFFFVQIEYMVIMSTNEYMITAFTQSEFVVNYQIYNKFFSLGSTLFMLALTPIWSVVTKALAENNAAWVNKLYKRLLLCAGIGCFLEMLIVPLLQIAVNLWLRDNSIEINYLYGFVFALLGCVTILTSVFSSIGNGAGNLKPQLILYGIGVVIKIPLAWLITRYTGSWIGVVIAHIISLGIYCVIQPLYLSKYLKKLEKK